MTCRWLPHAASAESVVPCQQCSAVSQYLHSSLLPAAALSPVNTHAHYFNTPSSRKLCYIILVEHNADIITQVPQTCLKTDNITIHWSIISKVRQVKTNPILIDQTVQYCLIYEYGIRLNLPHFTNDCTVLGSQFAGAISYKPGYTVLSRI